MKKIKVGPRNVVNIKSSTMIKKGDRVDGLVSLNQTNGSPLNRIMGQPIKGFKTDNAWMISGLKLSSTLPKVANKS